MVNNYTGLVLYGGLFANLGRGYGIGIGHCFNPKEAGLLYL